MLDLSYYNPASRIRKGFRPTRKNPQVAAPRAHCIGEVATMRAGGIWAKGILDVLFRVFLRSVAAGGEEGEVWPTMRSGGRPVLFFGPCAHSCAPGLSGAGCAGAQTVTEPPVGIKAACPGSRRRSASIPGRSALSGCPRSRQAACGSSVLGACFRCIRRARCGHRRCSGLRS